MLTKQPRSSFLARTLDMLGKKGGGGTDSSVVCCERSSISDGFA